ncbi:MAG TPA: hypothetical protein VD997_13640 [Phycisphaerales bacterium]|nr:hypothetical protein [Phycisphaerales bacterium]
MAIRKSWVADGAQVLVVAAGKGARDQAVRFGVYHSHNHRTFRPSKYIAFYHKGLIDLIAEIEGPPEDDVIIAQRPELAEWARVMPESNGDPWEPHCLFRLKNVQAIGPVVNNARDKNGDPTAWTQKQRYTTVAQLRSARVTSEI